MTPSDVRAFLVALAPACCTVGSTRKSGILVGNRKGCEGAFHFERAQTARYTVGSQPASPRLTARKAILMAQHETRIERTQLTGQAYSTASLTVTARPYAAFPRSPRSHDRFGCSCCYLPRD
ncbi:hypothetical protein OG21DRAFT_1513396 [Imleria badia]|nr:hypothetical protein OG21DRAFT_1513396 [Imleria badia]